MRPAPDDAPGAGERPVLAGWTGREIGIALWSSFLAASLATFLFFATFDPLALHDDAEVLREAFASRMSGYTLGFFFFWALTLVASATAVYLCRRSESRQPLADPASPSDPP